MKPLSYSLIAAALACGLASAQTTAYTTPVGYVSLGDTTVGQPAIKANTDSFLTIPLFNAAEYSGSVASVLGDVITLSGTPGFTASPGAGSWADGVTPYILLVENNSVASSGLVGLVTANGSDAVTVALQPGDSLSGVVAGDTVTLRKAWTLGNLFTGTTIPTQTQVSVYGNQTGINRPADAIFEFNGTIWENTDDFSDATGVVIYPGEGIKLRTPSSTAITSFVVSGSVSTANSRIGLNKYSAGAGQDNLIGYISPVNELIGNTNLGLTTGDQLIQWSNTAAGINKPTQTILEFNGTYWEDTDTFDDVTLTFNLEAGKAYRYRRAAAAPIGTQFVSDVPTFVPSL